MRPCEASDQHMDRPADQQARYVSDTSDLIDYQNEIYPFVQNDIVNGVTAPQNLLEYMVRKSAVELTFRKANQAVTLGSRPSVENWRSKVNM